MKRVALVAALLLLPLLVVAQETPCTDSGFSTVTTLRGTADLPSANGVVGTAWEFIVTRSASGEVRYSILVETIHLNGTPEAINGTSTVGIFDAITKTTVAVGVAQGYTLCSPCDDSVKVSHPTCVTRSGGGVDTKFSPCGATCSGRYFTVCCLQGPQSLVITPLPCSTSICTGCQGTCN